MRTSWTFRRHPWWTIRPEWFYWQCSSHTVLNFIKLARCWCLLITPTNKSALTNAGRTLEKIQHVFNGDIVNMVKTLWWTSRPKLPVHCGCCAALKFFKLTRCWYVHYIFLWLWYGMDLGNNTACVQYLHSEHGEGPPWWWTSRLELPCCGCHIAWKFTHHSCK